MPAAVSNACESLYEEHTALQVKKYFDSDPTRFKTLKQLFIFVHQLPVGINVRRIPKTEKGEFNKNPFKWLVNRCTGIWIGRITQHGIVDHCVAVDCKKGIIHDSSSRFPFALTEDILRRVGGDDATQLRVAEVREIVKVTLKNKKKTSNKRKRDN